MPYHLSDDGLTVLGEDGQPVPGGVHKSKRLALAHLRALEVNVEDAKSLFAKFGARNSGSDLERLQQIHDLAVENGAECGMGKALNLAYAKSLGLERLPDLAVKSVGKDEITGYLALWGSPDRPDIERDYFTKSTDFWDGRLSFPRPLTWEHGQDKEWKSHPVIGQIDSFTDDDFGRLYHATLDRSIKYRKLLDRFIDEGLLGTSSDTAPQYAEREKRGKAYWLKQWPLFSASLTSIPAEPRMLETVHFKSLGVTLPGWADGPDGQRQEDLKRSVENLKRLHDILTRYL